MEDIYGNLDNYEEENVIDELKSENKELKFKLEEYASTLSNLQKDFDKLSSEYKKLELNYSSLLKTAKAEIERKTRTITNLNLEKDQLVLNALQKRGRMPPNQFKKNQNKENSQKTDQHIVKGADSKKLNDDVNLQESTNTIEPSTLNNERNNIPEKTSSLDPTLKVITDEREEKRTAEDPNRYRDKYKSDTKEVKENTVYDVTEKAKDKVSKIRQRRKSMPLLNRGDFQFSSDEEQEDNTHNIREHRFRRKSPLREVIDRRHDRDRYNWCDSKNTFNATETTRGEDKSHRDSVRDNYYKRNSRYNDNDWHRRLDPRDRYDTRSKTRLNTDRYRFDARKEHLNDQSHRTDYGRHRVTVSSPPEKHNSFSRSRDLDRCRYQDEEAYRYKHKLHDVTDEPSYKRLRTESPKRRPEEHVMLEHDGHVAFQTAVPQSIPYSSLQSPDYSGLDPHPVHKVKEIKGTASTKLDDPRLKSNKYVLNMHKDKVMLSTVVDRNVELKRINIDLWDVDKTLHKMPTPLREKPQISENFVSQIYTDINNPLLNLSLESGEVESEDVDDLTLTYLGNADKKLNTTKKNGDSKNILNVKYEQPELSKPQSHSESKVTKTQSEISDHNQRKWIIPLSNKLNPKPIEDLTANTKNEDKKGNLIRQCHKKNSHEEKKEMDKNKQLEANPPNLKSNSRRSARNKSKGQLPELGHEEAYVEKSMRDTVEGDLELSDETSDYTEFVDKTRYSKEKNGECDREPVIVRIPKEKLKEHDPDVTDDQQGVFKQEIGKLCKNKCADSLRLDKDPQPKKMIQEKELKSNKDNRHIKEDIKAKLCDLFGDSSSLITPDDLGFVEQPAVNPIANKYSPLFDNTQDAVDLNVKDMEKVQIRSSKVKLDEPVANSNHHDVKQDKKHKGKNNKTNSERKKKLKNTPENTSVKEPSRDNFKEVLNNEPNVVKTVIISTGVQNSSQTKDPICDKGQEISNILSLPNLKALATSTPHKLLLDKEIEQPLLVTGSTSTASNNTSTNSNVKGITEDSNVSKTSQPDLDVPEFRIVLKRRRKARAPN